MSISEKIRIEDNMFDSTNGIYFYSEDLSNKDFYHNPVEAVREVLKEACPDEDRDFIVNIAKDVNGNLYFNISISSCCGCDGYSLKDIPLNELQDKIIAIKDEDIEKVAIKLDRNLKVIFKDDLFYGMICELNEDGDRVLYEVDENGSKLCEVDEDGYSLEEEDDEELL